MGIKPTLESNAITSLELKLWEWSNVRTIGILFGGKSVSILEDWQHTPPRFGVIDGGRMTYYRHLVDQLTEKNHDQILQELKSCHEAALSIFAQKWAWVNMKIIFDFYIAVKDQSDEIINHFLGHHPEFEKWKLPAISDEDKWKIEEAYNNALANALSSIQPEAQIIESPGINS